MYNKKEDLWKEKVSYFFDKQRIPYPLIEFLFLIKYKNCELKNLLE